jgi:ABC-2 type transport system ATP-binding protein
VPEKEQARGDTWMTWSTIDGVRVSYANNILLENVNITIPEGIVVIIGPNGVGKSTMISIMEGLTRIDNKDKVEVCGFSPYKKPEKAFVDVSFLPERSVGITGGTVKQWVQYYSLLRSVSSDKFASLLSIFDIEYVLSQKWKNLSNGEIQLVSNILCLSTRAKFFVMDEPNANLDIINRMRLAKVMRDMRKNESSSFLVTSHMLDEILPVSDFVIVVGKNSISGPLSLSDNSEKGGFIVLGVINPDLVYDALKGRFELEINDHEITVKNSNLKELITGIDTELLGNITSIHRFPSYLEGVLNFKKD